MCGETTNQLAEASQESMVLLDLVPPGQQEVGKTLPSWDMSQT